MHVCSVYELYVRCQTDSNNYLLEPDREAPINFLENGNFLLGKIRTAHLYT